MGKILVAVGEKKELMKIFNVSYVSVRRALNGENSTKLTSKIRKAAIERGGVEQPVAKLQTIK